MTRVTAVGSPKAWPQTAAEAAHQALAQPPEPTVGASAPPVITYLAATMRGALDRFDSQLAHAALDQLLATVSIEVAVAEVLVPYLHELGDRWAAGEATV